MDIQQTKDCFGQKNRFMFFFNKPLTENILTLFSGRGPISVNRAFPMPLVKQDVPGVYGLSLLIGGNRITIDFKNDKAREALLVFFTKELSSWDSAVQEET